MYNQYITPEDYATAEKNGIKKATLEARVRDLGWPIEQAVSEPPMQYKCFESTWESWRCVAAKNGISRELFYQRVRMRKVPEEEAATTPPSRGGRPRSKWSDEEIEIAKRNGVAGNGMSLPNIRILKLGWSREDAINTPKLSEAERIERVREGVKKRRVHREFNKTV